MEVGLDEDNTLFLTLVSTDKQTFEIKHEDCVISDYLKNLIEMDTSCTAVQIKTTGNLLQIIVEFLKHYNTEPFHRIQKPVPKDFSNCKFIHDAKNETFDASFYTNLLKNPNIPFMNLVHIVNYLSISPMLELVCARIANIVRDMTPEEEQRYLQINNQDYHEMKKTNDWAKN